MNSYNLTQRAHDLCKFVQIRCKRFQLSVDLCSYK